MLKIADTRQKKTSDECTDSSFFIHEKKFCSLQRELQNNQATSDTTHVGKLKRTGTIKKVNIDIAEVISRLINWAPLRNLEICKWHGSITKQKQQKGRMNDYWLNHKSHGGFPMSNGSNIKRKGLKKVLETRHDKLKEHGTKNMPRNRRCGIKTWQLLLDEKKRSSEIKIRELTH